MYKKIGSVIIVWMMLCMPLWASSEPQIAAEGAILIEPRTNTVLYAKNANQKFYPASTTKILTALILQEEEKSKVITKTQASVKNVPSDSSQIGVPLGGQYTLETGLYGLLIGSDNYIAYDLATQTAGSIEKFADKMNETAKKCGATSSHFTNPHGYQDPNHYTTPYDLAQIGRVAFENQATCQITTTQQYSFKLLNQNKSIVVSNRSKLVRKDSPYYNSHVKAVKNGYHSDAKQTLVAKAVYGDTEFIAVVMKTNNPNHYLDMNKLFEYGANHFQTVTDEKGQKVLVNKTAGKWADEYVQAALKQGWIERDGTNYEKNISSIALVNMVKKALKIEKDLTVREALRVLDIPDSRNVTTVSWQEAICKLCEVYNKHGVQ